MNRLFRAAAAAGPLAVLALFSTIVSMEGPDECDPSGGNCLYCYDYRYIHESLYACGE